ncbi:MAG: prenyltransferase/squalene oxidase repeat-containing protein [bacterium]
MNIKISNEVKKVIKILGLTIFSFILLANFVNAETNVNLTIRDGNTIIFSGPVSLQPSGTINLNDSNGIPHPLDANSVLSVINDADQLSSDFNISDLIYYDSYGSFYLKCITDSTGNQCNNWQYAVNDATPGLGMDKNILSGGENIYLYFGQNHKINLSSNSITTADTLTINTNNYHYQDNTWVPLTGVTVGLTQTDPSNPWTPIEIKTNVVDVNGQTTFSSIPIGIYNIGIKEDFYFPTEILNVTTPPDPIPVYHGGGGGGAIMITQEKNKEIKSIFDTKKAYEFLISQQKENGSFGTDLYTDWVSVVIATNTDYQIQKDKLIKYQKELKTENYQLTDYERHVIGLMTLGINPYDVNGINFIEKIIKEFDGEQFGNKEEDNDDIFALIVLQNAGYKQDEEIIKKTINFILSKQKVDGSWDNSVDMTGAAIQAIAAFAGENFLLRGVSQADEPRGSAGVATPDSDLEKEEFSSAKAVISAIIKAKEFLKQNQKDKGGFGNVSTTAWAIGGILSLGEKIEDWKKNDNTPFDYLGANQDIDGGIKENDINTKIWETSYVLSAMSGKTWNQIMQKFEKPIIIEEKKIEEKPIIKEITIKKEVKIQNKKMNKIENIAKNNIASPIIAINQLQEEKITPNQNWFSKLLKTIFGF